MLKTHIHTLTGSNFFLLFVGSGGISSPSSSVPRLATDDVLRRLFILAYLKKLHKIQMNRNPYSNISVKDSLHIIRPNARCVKLNAKEAILQQDYHNFVNKCTYAHAYTFAYVCAYMYIKRVLELNTKLIRRIVVALLLSEISRAENPEILSRGRGACGQIYGSRHVPRRGTSRRASTSRANSSTRDVTRIYARGEGNTERYTATLSLWQLKKSRRHDKSPLCSFEMRHTHHTLHTVYRVSNTRRRDTLTATVIDQRVVPGCVRCVQVRTPCFSPNSSIAAFRC